MLNGLVRIILMKGPVVMMMVGFLVDVKHDMLRILTVVWQQCDAREAQLPHEAGRE